MLASQAEKLGESRARNILRFGVFEADLDARELRKHGLRVKLKDQPFQVLALLIQCPDEIFARESSRWFWSRINP